MSHPTVCFECLRVGMVGNERVPEGVEDRWFRRAAKGYAGGSWEYTAAVRLLQVSAECRLRGVEWDWVWS